MRGSMNDTVRGMKSGFAKDREANLFLVIALCFGIAMACINPPFQECDGWFHYLLAMDVSYGNVFYPVVNLSSHENGLIIVPENIDDIDFCILEPYSGDGQEFVRHLKETRFSKNTKEMGLNGKTASVFYYPQALGIFLGRLFNLSVYSGVMLSRFFNLLVFAALTYMAVKITPIMKCTLAAAALFPMTIYQASSNSSDGMNMGLCFLFTAVCFSYGYGKKECLSWKDVLNLGGLLGLIFLYRFVYVCLGVLVFLIPKEKFGSKKQYWKCFFVGLLPLAVLGSIGMVNLTSIVAQGQASALSGGITQIQYLMQHPLFVIKVLYTTFLQKFQEYMTGLNTLGSLNYVLGPLVFIVPLVVTFIGAVDRNEACEKIKRKDILVCLSAISMVSIGIAMGLYIGDGRINEVGALAIQGIQGRYFIPLIPVFFLVVSPKGITNNVKHFSEKVMGILAVILMFSLYLLHGCCA